MEFYVCSLLCSFAVVCVVSILDQDYLSLSLSLSRFVRLVLFPSCLLLVVAVSSLFFFPSPFGSLSHACGVDRFFLTVNGFRFRLIDISSSHVSETASLGAGRGAKSLESLLKSLPSPWTVPSSRNVGHSLPSELRFSGASVIVVGTAVVLVNGADNTVVFAPPTVECDTS